MASGLELADTWLGRGFAVGGGMKGFRRVALQAQRQAGLISRRQLFVRGYTPSAVQRALASGVLLKHQPGVYRLPGVPLTEQTRLWAAVLWANGEAFLSHRTAAHWCWKLDGLSRKPPETIELVTLVHSGWSPPRGIRLRQVSTLEAGDTLRVNGLPYTSLARTVVDLASVLPPEELEMAMDAAIRRRGGIEDEVAATLERLGRQGRAGAGAIGALIEREPILRTGSPLEIKVRNVIARAGITAPIPQLSITDRSGEQICVADFAWPERRVALFVQSARWHRGSVPFEKDTRQSFSLGANGWRPLPITYKRLMSDPAGFVKELRSALAAEV